MSIETFVLVPTGDQNLDSMAAFAKGLMLRRIANGVLKQDGKVSILMLPPTAGRYIGGKPSYEDDKEAVLSAIKGAGYKLEGEAAEEPVPAPAKPKKAEKVEKDAVSTVTAASKPA